MGPAEYASGVARSPVWLEQSNQGGEYQKMRSEGTEIEPLAQKTCKDFRVPSVKTVFCSPATT